MIKGGKNILGSLREYKTLSLLTVFFIILEAVFNALIPFITAQLINNLQGQNMDMGAVSQIGLLLLVMAGLSLTAGGLAGFTSAKASSGFAKNLRGDLFRKIQTYSFGNIDKFSTPSLITRLTTDIDNVMMSFMILIRESVRAPLVIIFAFIMAFRMAGSLAYSFLIIIPFLAVAFFLIIKFAMPYFRKGFRQFDVINRVVGENVQAAREVKAYARGDYEKEKFKGFSEDMMKIFTKADTIVNFSSPVMQMAIYFNMLFIFAVGSQMVVSSGGVDLNVGQMSAMLTYGMQIMIQLMFLSMVFVLLTMSAESVRRINEILAEESSLHSPEGGAKELADGSVAFHGVSFKYSEEAEAYTLSDLDFRIESGMTVGILGGTGSGKSSLVQLIPRLYDVSRGSIEVGGRDVRDYDLESLRDQAVLVLQKNVLFSGTIADNIRWGNPRASDEEVEWAAKLAQADAFIRSFPESYQTYIEQGGTNVSGGQRQRLTIARALLKKPKILIFDDSTSAVDTKTDALIQKSLKESLPGTTKIFIAQRISSVKDADRIIVMQSGKILAMGSHEELLKKVPSYRETYEKQGGGVHVQ